MAGSFTHANSLRLCPSGAMNIRDGPPAPCSLKVNRMRCSLPIRLVAAIASPVVAAVKRLCSQRWQSDAEQIELNRKPKGRVNSKGGSPTESCFTSGGFDGRQSTQSLCSPVCETAYSQAVPPVRARLAKLALCAHVRWVGMSFAAGAWSSRDADSQFLGGPSLPIMQRCETRELVGLPTREYCAGVTYFKWCLRFPRSCRDWRWVIAGKLTICCFSLRGKPFRQADRNEQGPLKPPRRWCCIWIKSSGRTYLHALVPRWTLLDRRVRVGSRVASEAENLRWLRIGLTRRASRAVSPTL